MYVNYCRVMRLLIISSREFVYNGLRCVVQMYSVCRVITNMLRGKLSEFLFLLGLNLMF